MSPGLQIAVGVLGQAIAHSGTAATCTTASGTRGGERRSGSRREVQEDGYFRIADLIRTVSHVDVREFALRSRSRMGVIARDCANEIEIISRNEAAC